MNPTQRQYRLLTITALITLGVGTIFYHFVEGWKWLDSLYFCVVTLATVGYGDYVPTTDLGKAFTILYILTGVAIIAAFANSLFQRAAKHREKKERERNKT